MTAYLAELVHEEHGQALTEYAMILAFVGLAAALFIRRLAAPHNMLYIRTNDAFKTK